MPPFTYSAAFDLEFWDDGQLWINVNGKDCINQMTTAFLFDHLCTFVVYIIEKVLQTQSEEISQMLRWIKTRWENNKQLRDLSQVACLRDISPTINYFALNHYTVTASLKITCNYDKRHWKTHRLFWSLSDFTNQKVTKVKNR